MKLAAGLSIAILVGVTASISAQEAVPLPAATVPADVDAQTFSFVSDGPKGPGWTRPDEIARTYFNDELPALFRRTIVLNEPVPRHGKLQWIFTGPHAGITVELSPSKVRIVERYIDSYGLGGGGSYPERIVRDEERQFTGAARTLTVILDSHLAVALQVNGATLLNEACTFDILRHQLVFSAPRTEHLTLSGALLSSPIQTSSVVINAAAKHQTMLGFGGSPSVPAYEHLSAEGKQRYWAIMRHYNLLIDREYPMGSELKPDLSNRDDLHDATPHYYGDNFPNGEVSSFAYNKQAQAIGGDVIYEMWALPAWATQPYKGPRALDAWNKPVTTAANPDEYARIMVDYCRREQQATGRPPAILGIQNEVEQPPEIFAQMIVTLRRELDKAGFQSVKIHMADASYMYYGAQRARDLQRTPDAWSKIDFTAVHEYDYQEFLANPDLYDAAIREMHEASAGKPFLATEICLNDPHYQELSYRLALNVGQLYDKNLTELDAEMLLYCWLILDVEEPSFGGSRSLLVPDKINGDMPIASSFELRVLGAFSRHVLKGMARIDAISSNPDLLTTAFVSGKDRTLIVLNRSTERQRINLSGTDAHWAEMERTSQRLENSISSAIPSEVVVEPGEIVTLSTLHAK
jgi:O-glycosyl hydrolase